MANERILVVEDESIVAQDIRNRLEDLGYAVPAIAASGEDALRKVSETRPDLVLMDITLKGKMDGVETSRRMRDRFNIPVVYLTAHVDDGTLQRAKITEPFGYIIKPFEERELRTNIEIALYKHQAERRIQESERRLAAILQSIGDGVIATDAEGRVTYMNPVAEALTGWKQQEASGQAAATVFPVRDQKTRISAENPVSVSLRENRVTAVTLDALLVDREGNETPVANTAAPIAGADGKVAGAVLVFRDISEHARTEKYMREVEKLQSIGQLAGGVAHEFNNLLMIIRGHSELFLCKLDEGDDLRGNITEIRDAADRAASLTHQLLAFSRQQVMRPKVVNLNEIVAAKERKLRGLLGSDSRLVFELSPALGNVLADPGQIEQVILELAANGRDAISRGGQVTIRTANVEGTEAPGRPQQAAVPCPQVLLAVSDTGVGMNKEIQDHIFEPFFTTKEPTKRPGLGLATVHGVVMQSGGNICVDSEVGQGTTVEIYLPRIEAATDGQKVE